MATDSLADNRRIISRIAAGLLGGYLFVWGFTTFGITALPLFFGLTLDDAYHLSMLLAFLCFLFVFCWAFVSTSVRRVWKALVGGGLALTCLASVFALIQL